jgi:hypothetical protein
MFAGSISRDSRLAKPENSTASLLRKHLSVWPLQFFAASGGRNLRTGMSGRSVRSCGYRRKERKQHSYRASQNRFLVCSGITATKTESLASFRNNTHCFLLAGHAPLEIPFVLKSLSIDEFFAFIIQIYCLICDLQSLRQRSKEKERKMATKKANTKSNEIALVPYERIASAIYLIRGHKVILDRDLAQLYGVETRVLKQAVRRNSKRFPKDFMFVMNKKEFETWRSQFVTSKADRKGLRYAPMAFTEQGVAMLSSVLNSNRAIEVNVAIMRAFVRLREFLSSQTALAKKLHALEKKVEEQGKGIELLFEAIQQLMSENVPAIGFHANMDKDTAGHGVKKLSGKRSKSK